MPEMDKPSSSLAQCKEAGHDSIALGLINNPGDLVNIEKDKLPEVFIKSCPTIFQSSEADILATLKTLDGECLKAVRLRLCELVLNSFAALHGRIPINRTSNALVCQDIVILGSTVANNNPRSNIDLVFRQSDPKVDTVITTGSDVTNTNQGPNISDVLLALVDIKDQLRSLDDTKQELGQLQNRVSVLEHKMLKVEQKEAEQKSYVGASIVNNDQPTGASDPVENSKKNASGDQVKALTQSDTSDTVVTDAAVSTSGESSETQTNTAVPALKVTSGTQTDTVVCKDQETPGIPSASTNTPVNPVTTKNPEYQNKTQPYSLQSADILNAPHPLQGAENKTVSYPLQGAIIQKEVSIYMGRVNPLCDENSIKNHLIGIGVTPSEVSCLANRNGRKSFKLTVPKNAADGVLQSHSWPDNVIVQPFRNKTNDNTKRNLPFPGDKPYKQNTWTNSQLKQFGKKSRKEQYSDYDEEPHYENKQPHTGPAGQPAQPRNCCSCTGTHTTTLPSCRSNTPYQPAAGLCTGATGVYPTTAGVYPAVAGVYPTAAGAYPTSTGVYPPATGACPTAAGGYPPTTGVYSPAAGVYPPSTGVYTGPNHNTKLWESQCAPPLSYNRPGFQSQQWNFQTGPSGN